MIYIIIGLLILLLLIIFIKVIRAIKIKHDKKKYGLYSVVTIKNKILFSRSDMKKFSGKSRVNSRSINAKHYGFISSIDPETNDITINTINSLSENSKNRKKKVDNGELLPIPRDKTNMNKSNAIHNKILRKNKETNKNLNMKDIENGENNHGKKISTSFIPKIKKHLYNNKKQKYMSSLNRKVRHKKH